MCIFTAILLLLLVPFSSAFCLRKLPPIRSKTVTIAVVPSSIQDLLQVLGEVTKDIGNLGPVAPLALGIFLLNGQDRKFDDVNKATREIFMKDIKATNDALSKDIKVTSDAIKVTSDALSKDIKVTNDAIKATNDALSKDIKVTNDALSKDIKVTNDAIKATNDALSKDISRLEKIVEKVVDKIAQK
jgi:hypothetical protein